MNCSGGCRISQGVANLLFGIIIATNCIKLIKIEHCVCMCLCVCWGGGIRFATAGVGLVAIWIVAIDIIGLFTSLSLYPFYIHPSNRAVNEDAFSIYLSAL